MTTSGASPQNSSNLSLLKIILPVLGILVLATGSLYMLKAFLPHRETVTELREGSEVPDFTVTDLGGKARKLSEVGQFKVYLLNFWATWCEACMIEMPSIVELKNSFKDRGLEVLAINLDEKPEAVVPKAARDLNLNFPVFVDPEGALGELFDVHAIPHTIILDSHRKILMIHNGDRDWSGPDIRAKMEQWLSQ